MLHAVIMAGGSGTRFWPASRRDRPKQLLDLVSTAPLLRLTYERLGDLVPPERVWVITTQKTAGDCRKVLPEVPAGNILAEPVGRNTAACVGLAAQAVGDGDTDAVCLVLPADHLIGDEARFRSAVAAGARMVAENGGLLTFGVRPSRPETGYGYLEVGDEAARTGGWTIHQLTAFVEKPDAERASGYVSGGRHLWNAGIFAWRARDLLTEMHRQIPDLAAGLDRIAEARSSANAETVLAEVYPTLPATSVDHGIMEGARQCWVMPVDFPWSDVGSWPALADELPTDDNGNAVRGRVAALNAADNVLVSTGPVLSVVGVESLVVVATPDAVLVIPKDEAQRVKDVVDRIRDEGWDDVL
jgi:mannose-1-phosphate guanylyltransferase